MPDTPKKLGIYAVRIGEAWVEGRWDGDFMHTPKGRMESTDVDEIGDCILPMEGGAKKLAPMKFHTLADQGECEISVDLHDRADFICLGMQWRKKVEAWLSPEEAREVARSLHRHADALEKRVEDQR